MDSSYESVLEESASLPTLFTVLLEHFSKKIFWYLLVIGDFCFMWSALQIKHYLFMCEVMAIQNNEINLVDPLKSQ
jgi:purine-cytosine permease-like protein